MELPDNPNCDKTDVTLRFVAPELDPESVTSAVGIEPDVGHKRGDVRVVKNGRDYKFPNGIWYLTTEGWPSRNLEAHVVRMLERVQGVLELLTNYSKANPHVRFELMCHWVSASGHGGPSLSPQTLARIASLGATLDFDIYCNV
jgi:hypothetical protein